MPKRTVTSESPSRPFRILWANVYCMLDTSSGASIAVREMLRQLCFRGHEIAICGATIFDNERGRQRLADQWGEVESRAGSVISVKDDPLVHYLYVTQSHQRNLMMSLEENQWLSFYTATLDKLQPDLVYFYGGQALDMMIADEAKQRGIPAAALLVNQNFSGKRWCRDVDLIVTDSHATSLLYKQREGYDVVPTGTFIDPVPVVAAKPLRERVLLVNPSIEKGAAIVARLAMLLEERRPDIQFEVVESRGNWSDVVKQVSSTFGSPRESLNNVIVTSNTDDMRPVFGRARVLLAFSLWFESAGRVIAEAMMNGIPAIVSNYGGPPEMIGQGGFLVDLPPKCHQAPYTEIPSDELLEQILAIIIRMYDDGDFYTALSQKAFAQAEAVHNMRHNILRLEAAFLPLMKRKRLLEPATQICRPKARKTKQQLTEHEGVQQ
jgi:glycosyltransferase involved in cell wall biosynthesis